MSRWWDDVAVVVELAKLTEDRTRSEEAALRRVAKKVDQKRNEETVTNPNLLKLAAGWRSDVSGGGDAA